MRLAVAALVVSAGCGGSPCGASEGKVTRVIDGDTIELETGDRIRYLLVDTPEVSGGVECFGAEARQLNTDLVLNKTVQISYDVECTDNFDRTLAYVTVGGEEVNTLLIQRGYACVLFIAPNGESRRDELERLQLDAKNARRGLWSACDPLPPACT
ncbi:MAG TPA: thermonuclease family protein [Kofleriaceae bacterium]